MYDAIVIGGGPGGYACAIRIAQLGGKAALIEKDKLGGTCTNVGCIPTKALLASSGLAQKISKASSFGLGASATVDFRAVMKRANSIASNLSKGISLLLQSNGVEVFSGTGKIKSKSQVEVNGKTLEAKTIVIATGSAPVELPFAKFGTGIISSESVWQLTEKPESLAIIGGGVEGAEFACAFNSLGVKVTVIELLDRILSLEDPEAGQAVFNSLKREGVSFILGKKVEKIEGTTVTAGGEAIRADKVMVAVGRRPSFDGDALTRLGVSFDKRGIKTNERMQTSVPGIYAIGDAAGGHLAHEASAHAIVAAENIMGKPSAFGSSAIPACIFTSPEIARVGKTQEAPGVKTGRFPFAASSKASCMGEKTGFVKVFLENGVLVGALIVGPHASDLIAEAALAVQLKARAEDIAGTVHAHPTLSEAFKEAVEDALGKAIHLPRKQ